jgi:hypothetical protein
LKFPLWQSSEKNQQITLVPTDTRAAQVLEQVMPHLKAKHFLYYIR